MRTTKSVTRQLWHWEKSALRPGRHAPEVSELLKDQNELVSKSVAFALGNLGPGATDQAPKIGSFIQELNKDQKANRVKIVAGVDALGNMGNAAKKQGPIVAELLLGTNVIVRAGAVRALQQMAPLEKDTALIILASAYLHPFDTTELRLLAHSVAGDDQDSETLISWLGKSKKKTATKRDIENSSQTLNILLESWGFTQSHTQMRDDLVVAISEVAKSGNWTKEDIVALRKAEDTLKSKAFTDQANIISTKIGELGG
jgi:HEAT repeat protein